MNTMKTFFHPLYGVCVDFSPRQGPKDIVGTTEIGYMKVTVDFKAAFPQLEAKSDEKTLNTTQNKIRPGENTVVVFIYDKGLLFPLSLISKSNL